MGLMKRYMEDSDHIRQLARSTSQLDRAADRMAELDQVFRACGEMANKYADPESVAKRLVREAVYEYQAARTRLRDSTQRERLMRAA
ncbi:hypothetical protein [Streptomyces sp. ISL-11]|uniref:hypothetical protein n=1 Tax=Streptomyces sp. ISL-11 TaxID=2819174 RepID=UPI001BEA677D|nr:hypothetical protein [Streptomyces sp. ISL-11]MBT2383856.1 hypothetical protein [Streptomyces sp. ISL-11]